MQKRRKKGPKDKGRSKRPEAPRLRSSTTSRAPAPAVTPRPDPKLIEQVRDYVREFKKHYNVCADCDREYPPYVLEFDHVDPSQKRFNIGNAKSVPSMEALIEEINGADLVCSNCHKIREHERKVAQHRRSNGPIV